jgi:hypothetical protein
MEVPDSQGWHYGKVDREFVSFLRASLKKVHWIEEPQQAELFDSHSRDKSCHPTKIPEVIVFPQSAGDLSTFFY